MIIRPVILSGGSGTRMWPVSRTRFPKQFAELHGDECLFAGTLDLVSDRTIFDAPIIVANADHKFLILDILSRRDIKDAIILLEPAGRNTAAAALVAAVQDADKKDIAHLVLPSDHVISDRAAFLDRVELAKPAVAGGNFVLFGITPDRPETGYGYIMQGSATETPTVRAISRFVEKPTEDKAQELIEQGALWNSGIFFYSPKTLRAEAKKLLPRTLEMSERALQESTLDYGCTMLAPEPYLQMESVPFDRAIMEKTDKGAVIAGNFGWSDVGSWYSLWQTTDKDEHGNVKDGSVVTRDARGSYIRSYGPTIAVMGIENIVVVATKDAVLVAPMSRAQEVRELAAQVGQNNSALATEHPRVQRPWGSYEGIANGERFQVKQIKVLPGRSLSQQMHYHRSEHWVVLSGTAKVECNGEEKTVFPNQSVFIPVGARHRLSNPGHVDLHLIEVQSGDYVGEDDIVRFADKYGRA